MDENTKYLGIDYGIKRIGLSISDTGKSFAFQRDYVYNDSNLMKTLMVLIKSENVNKIILGYPTRFNSEKTHITDDVEKFSAELKAAFIKESYECEVVFFDERLTSSLAQYNLANSGVSRKKQRDKGNIDSISAQIILQDYLDYIKNKK
ncbi:MAG: Holliday junction resolvase RuvX [Ignavibacteria bacterium]|nr:Holliday junction resolvase RuvX [Ignavibacteria bacterium]